MSLDSKLVETQQTQIHYKQSAQFITLLNFLERGQMTSAAFTRTAARTMRSGIRTTKIHIHRWHRAASGATLYMVTNYFHELIERRRERERKIAALQAVAEGQCQPYTFTTCLAARSTIAGNSPAAAGIAT